jgi:hypothetical protein
MKLDNLKTTESHIYNLRMSLGYKKYRFHDDKTKSPTCAHILSISR